jgi:hypothetical protein
MGRQRAGLVCFPLVSRLRIAWMLPRFTAFGVLDFRALIRGRSLMLSLLCLLEILRLCIDDDTCSMLTWLFGDLFYYGWLLR